MVGLTAEIAVDGDIRDLQVGDLLDIENVHLPEPVVVLTRAFEVIDQLKGSGARGRSRCFGGSGDAETDACGNAMGIVRRDGVERNRPHFVRATGQDEVHFRINGVGIIDAVDRALHGFLSEICRRIDGNATSGTVRSEIAHAGFRRS